MRRSAAVRAGSLALALGAVLGLGAPAPASASAARTPPRLAVSSHSAAPGSQITLNGSGLPGSGVFTVQICGDAARHGSVDCNLSNARTSTSSSTGRILVTLPVVRPPTACPCVISVLSTDLDRPLVVPFTVLGVRVAPLTPQPARLPPARLVVLSATLSGDNSASAWFGATRHQTLSLTVTNTGAAAVVAPPLVLTIDPTLGSSQTLATPILGTIPAHGTQTYDIPVRIGAVSAGRYRVHGTVGFVGNDVSFAATTDAVPWGLLILVAILVQLGLLTVRDRLRRRLDDTDDGESPLAAELREPAQTA